MLKKTYRSEKAQNTNSEIKVQNFMKTNMNLQYSNCGQKSIKHKLQEYLDWKWWIGGIMMVIVALFGVLGNVTSMIVLVRPKIREVAFNQLLTCLCVVDTIFLACNSLSMAHALGHDNGKWVFIIGKMPH